MQFFVYDIIFFAIFAIIVTIFLIKRRKKLQVESKILLLYRTKVGIRFINWTTKKFPRFLNVMQYFSITFGYFAILGAILLMLQSISSILTMPTVPKVPPITPLFPYMPQAFNLPLPPFYFTYWLLIIVIIAVTHEFSHGIFAKLNKIKIKATGFGFLGPFLAAFVEPDEKKMAKKGPKAQLAVLAGGSFANVLTAILFLLILQAYFFGFYEKAGITGYTFSADYVNTSNIISIGTYAKADFFNLTSKELEKINYTLEVKTTDGKNYFYREELSSQIISASKGAEKIILYTDTPAINADLQGAIQKIGDYNVNSMSEAIKAIESYEPEDNIKVQTLQKENGDYVIKNYYLTLAKHPNDNSKPYLGIGFAQQKGILSAVSKVASPFFTPNVYAKPKFDENLTIFVQDFLFWLIIIAFSVAFLNMLPLGILDGGRFLYITIFAITKSKKTSQRVYKIFSSIIILMFFLLMFFWVIRL